MGTRTALFSQRQIGGLFSIEDMNFTTGHRWFVGSAVAGASDGVGYGQNPDGPFATLDYAFSSGSVVANSGDIIYAMPGHAETASTDVELFDMDVAGVKIIGLGWGDQRPTFTLAHADATMVLGAASSWLENIRIVGNISTLVTALEVEAAADGSVIKGCYFKDSATNKDMVIAIAVAAAADRLRIIDNHFNIITGGEATDCIKLAGESAGTIIANNIASGDWKTGGFVNGNTAAATGLMILNNLVVNQDATAGLCIKGHASSTGLITGNLFAGNKANTEPISTVTAMHMGYNLMTDTAAAAAIISATATAWT